MRNPNPTPYNLAPLVVTTTTEAWVTLTVACIPPSASVLKTIIRKISPIQVFQSKSVLGSEAARKRRTSKIPTFGPKSLNHFQSLAYATGTIHDHGHGDGSLDSTDRILIMDTKGIIKRTEVDIRVHHEPIPMRLQSLSGEEKAATTFDQV